jgi:predicted nucleic acid-binding protein
MSDRAFVDTNVLVYAFDDDEPAKQARARSLIGARGGPTLVISTQILAEFFVTVTRKLATPVSFERARLAVAELVKLPVVSLSADLVIKAVDTSDRHQISLWDAQVIEAAVGGGCTQVLTEDLSSGSKMRGIEIINPFAGIGA